MQNRIYEIIFILNNVKYNKKGLTTNVKRYDYTTDKWYNVKDDVLNFSFNSTYVHFKFKDILKYFHNGYDIEKYLPEYKTWVNIRHLINPFDEDDKIIPYLKGLGRLRVAPNMRIISGDLVDRDKSLIDLLKKVKIDNDGLITNLECIGAWVKEYTKCTGTSWDFQRFTYRIVEENTDSLNTEKFRPHEYVTDMIDAMQKVLEVYSKYNARH